MNRSEIFNGQIPIHRIGWDQKNGQTPTYWSDPETGEIIVLNSLPLSSRTANEVLEDHATEVAFQASYNRSLTRRKPKRYESGFVVNYLDRLAYDIDIIGAQVVDMALKQIGVLSQAEQFRRELSYQANQPARYVDRFINFFAFD